MMISAYATRFAKLKSFYFRLQLPKLPDYVVILLPIIVHSLAEEIDPASRNKGKNENIS